MIQPRIDPDFVISYLNTLLELDNDCMQELFSTRVGCNSDIEQNSEAVVIITFDSNGYKFRQLGLIGIINGLIGLDKDDCGYIAAEVGCSSNKILKFVRTPNFLKLNKESFHE